MGTERSFKAKLSIVSVTLVILVISEKLTLAQTAPVVRVGGVEITGIPEDWSSRHVVFSNPGAELLAVQNGRHREWQKIVNDPRYVLQQLKKHQPVEGPAAADAAYRGRWITEAADGGSAGANDFEPTPLPGRRGGSSTFGYRRPISPEWSIKRDWSMPLGGPGLAAGQYPAKYSAYWSTGTASCSDFVVYPTGAAGSGTKATIIAFKNLYVGGSGNPCAASNPSVYWAYNTGGTAKLSPVLSWDGTQVAYIQADATSGVDLVLLHTASSGGAYNSPANITHVTAANYKSCNTGPNACYTYVQLSGATSDSQSAPYYDYASDTIYVGDDQGYLHKITNVFGATGTPTETMSSGWPVQVSSATSPALTSPVLDPGASTLLFAGDASGYLHSITSTGATRTVLTSNQLVCGAAGFVDPPIIDPTTENVYAFVGYGCDSSHNSYVNRFTAGTSISGSYGANYANLGNGGTANPTASALRAGSFDNQYYTGIGITGNLYVCENGRVYQITMATLNGTATPTVSTFNTPVSSVGSAATCSPVTEFLSVKANTTLSAAITSTTATTVHISAGSGIANSDYIQVDSEIMHVSSGGGTATLTVARGQLGTTTATHSNGANVQDIQDWIFLSVDGNGNVASCTGACLYNYNVISGVTSGAPTAGIAETGGTSGIVVDNLSTTQTGAEQIYFNNLGATTSNAVQTSQSNP
jgi:hypothetical protein